MITASNNSFPLTTRPTDRLLVIQLTMQRGINRLECLLFAPSYVSHGGFS